MKNRLEQIRKEKGITQEELADALEVSRQTVGSLENGRYNPSIILAYKIAKYFNLTIEEIFIYEEDKKWKNKKTQNFWYIGYVIGICGLILALTLKLNESVEIVLSVVFVAIISLSHVKIMHYKMMKKDHTYKINMNDERNEKIKDKVNATMAFILMHLMGIIAIIAFITKAYLPAALLAISVAFSPLIMFFINKYYEKKY